MEKKLCLSSSNKWIAGVCGGIAEYFDINPLVVRIVFIVVGLLLGFLSLVLIALYAALWFILSKSDGIDVPIETVAQRDTKKQPATLSPVSGKPVDERISDEIPSPEMDTDVSMYFDDNDFSIFSSVDIPEGVTDIPDMDSDENTEIKNLVIPNSVTSIGDAAFYDCSGLTEVTIPNSVTSIGDAAFFDCSGLTEVTIPNSVTSIGGDAFLGCTSLKKVIVEDIAAWCNISFGNSYANPLYYAHHLYSDENTEIKNLVIPNSVTSIGDFAFALCSGLTSVTIPNSVTSIGDCAFDHCSGLTSVTIPNSVTSIGEDAFYDCSGLTSVTIGNSVTSIGDRAFWGCSGLTKVTIPNSVTSIGEDAFYCCGGLTSVTIPNSVTNIGGDAFPDGCTIKRS